MFRFSHFRSIHFDALGFFRLSALFILPNRCRACLAPRHFPFSIPFCHSILPPICSRLLSFPCFRLCSRSPLAFDFRRSTFPVDFKASPPVCSFSAFLRPKTSQVLTSFRWPWLSILWQAGCGDGLSIPFPFFAFNTKEPAIGAASMDRNLDRKPLNSRYFLTVWLRPHRKNRQKVWRGKALICEYLQNGETNSLSQSRDFFNEINCDVHWNQRRERRRASASARFAKIKKFHSRWKFDWTYRSRSRRSLLRKPFARRDLCPMHSILWKYSVAILRGER
jgi:hypothetical protein